MWMHGVYNVIGFFGGKCVLSRGPCRTRLGMKESGPRQWSDSREFSKKETIVQFFLKKSEVFGLLRDHR